MLGKACKQAFLNYNRRLPSGACGVWRCALYGHVFDCEFIIASFPIAPQKHDFVQ